MGPINKHYAEKDAQIAAAVARSKAEHSGKLSDWGFRSERGGEYVGLVKAWPDKKTKTYVYDDDRLRPIKRKERAIALEESGQAPA